MSGKANAKSPARAPKVAAAATLPANAGLTLNSEAVTPQHVAPDGMASGEVSAATKVRALDDASRNGTMAVCPRVNGAAVTATFATNTLEGPVEMLTVWNELEGSIAKVNAGDMKEPEAMLMSQAIALQAIFTSMARNAGVLTLTQPGSKPPNPDTAERWMRMAMKAQNQCRMTLETLATIKNPPVIFARQANIANGPQQVNNGLQQGDGGLGTHAPAGKSGTVPIELLGESTHGQRLDTAAARTPSGDDAQTAPVGAVDRAAHA